MSNTRNQLIYLLFVLLSWPCLAESQDPMLSAKVAGKITEFGIQGLKAQILETDKKASDPTEHIKHIDIGEMAFVGTQDRIKMKRGITFGVKAAFYSDEKGVVPITYILLHPKMKLPDGRVVEKRESIKPTMFTNGYAERGDLFSIEYDYEMVPGDWTFIYMFEGKFITTKTLTLY